MIHRWRDQTTMEVVRASALREKLCVQLKEIHSADLNLLDLADGLQRRVLPIHCRHSLKKVSCGYLPFVIWISAKVDLYAGVSGRNRLGGNPTHCHQCATLHLHRAVVYPRSVGISGARRWGRCPI